MSPASPAPPALSLALIRLIADLTRDLPADMHCWRLLDYLGRELALDGSALLKLEQEHEGSPRLHCIAADSFTENLQSSVLEAEHPGRLAYALQSRDPVVFEAGSDFDDVFAPYRQPSHPARRPLAPACLAASLYVTDQLWGLLYLEFTPPGKPDELSVDSRRGLISLVETLLHCRAHFDKLRNAGPGPRQTSEPDPRPPGHSALLGQSPVMEAIREEITILAGASLPILIRGEHGVGKHTIAREIHRHSPLAAQPWRELAYGPGQQDRDGDTSDPDAATLESALQRPLFLVIDELTQLPTATQTRLLHWLDALSARPSEAPISRLIALSSHNLQTAVREGKLMPDLYQRLMLYTMDIAPLRERREDIAVLAAHFLISHCQKLGLPRASLSVDAISALEQQHWPGNIRELDYCLYQGALGFQAQSAHSRSTHLQLSAAQLGLRPPAVLAGEEGFTPPTGPLNLRVAMDDYQRYLIRQRLFACSGNGAAVARELGLNRSNFYRLLKRLGLHQG